MSHGALRWVAPLRPDAAKSTVLERLRRRGRAIAAQGRSAFPDLPQLEALVVGLLERGAGTYVVVEVRFHGPRRELQDALILRRRGLLQELLGDVEDVPGERAERRDWLRFLNHIRQRAPGRWLAIGVGAALASRASRTGLPGAQTAAERLAFTPLIDYRANAPAPPSRDPAGPGPPH